VEWRIPRSYAAATTETIQVWARQPGSQDPKVLSDWGWLAPWAYRLSIFDAVIPLLLTLTGCFITLLYRVKKNRESRASGVQWLFLLPSVVSLVFWFVTAPDPRYAGAPFWVLGAGAITLATQESELSFNRKRSRVATFLCVATVASLVVSSFIGGKASAFRVMIKETNPLKALRQLSVNRDSGFHGAPQVELNTFVTRSGLTMYSPKNGKQCWDAPLPCARRPIPDLRLRREGDMSHGFICSEPEAVRKQDSESLNRNRDIEIDMCN